MEIGDYVRANARTLKKFVGITKCESEDKNYWYCEDLTIYKKYAEDYNFKSSPNIIELLEPMDLLYIDIDGGFEGGIVVPRMAETQDELNGFVEFIKSGHWILKGVVTHEQLENNMYKVGE